MTGLESVTRRESLRLLGLGGAGLVFGLSSEATAKPDLPLLTEREFEANVYKVQNPVIVLFYDASPASQRMEYVLDALARQYSHRVDFYKFDVNRFLVDHGGNRPAQGYALMRLTGLPDTRIPKTVMYAIFDVVSGKKFEQNVAIDVLKGGPSSDSAIQDWTIGEKAGTGWIESNLVRPNGQYALRLNNSANPKLVTY